MTGCNSTHLERVLASSSEQLSYSELISFVNGSGRVPFATVPFGWVGITHYEQRWSAFFAPFQPAFPRPPHGFSTTLLATATGLLQATVPSHRDYILRSSSKPLFPVLVLSAAKCSPNTHPSQHTYIIARVSAPHVKRKQSNSKQSSQHKFIPFDSNGSLLLIDPLRNRR